MRLAYYLADNKNTELRLIWINVCFARQFNGNKPGK